MSQKKCNYPFGRSEFRSQALVGQSHTLLQSPDESCTGCTEKRSLQGETEREREFPVQTSPLKQKCERFVWDKHGGWGTSEVGVASVSAVCCDWIVWTCWTRRSQYRRSSDIFVFRQSGPGNGRKTHSKWRSYVSQWGSGLLLSYLETPTGWNFVENWWDHVGTQLNIDLTLFNIKMLLILIHYTLCFPCTFVFVTVQCSSFGRA